MLAEQSTRWGYIFIKGESPAIGDALRLIGGIVGTISTISFIFDKPPRGEVENQDVGMECLGRNQ